MEDRTNTDRTNKEGRSFVTRTVFRVSVVFIVAITIIFVVFTIFTSTYMRNNILQAQQERVELATSSMESRFGSFVGPMMSLERYAPAIRLLEGYHESYSVEWLDDVRSLDAYLRNINMFSEYIIDIVLIRADSQVIYGMSDTLRRDYDYVNSDWFRQAFQREGVLKYAAPHGIDHLFHSGTQHTFSVIYPIYRFDVLVGYILVECNLNKFADFISTGAVEESGFLLLDDQNIVIYDYLQERTETVFAPEFDLEDLVAGSSTSFEDNGRLYNVHRLEANSWVIVLESDAHIMLLPIRRWLSVVLVLGALVFALLVLITIYNTRQMEKPLESLIKLKQKEMELEALTNQVNPHFIYNVFQVIQTKAVLSDNREIEDMIQALSQMMRYTMERKRDKVFIRDEVNYIERYLMFYKERFSSLFDYEIEYEPEVLDYKALKFILQPVVENCFKHAFKERKTGGMIKVRIYEKGEEIIFQVWDNGCGISQDKIKLIQDKLDYEDEADGIGIYNSSSRIHLVYGSQYGIQIDSKVDEYTSVTIRIPRER